MERVLFLKTEIWLWEFNTATGTPADDDTTKLLNLDPQPPKKLHSLTSRV
jgi:hypothetical protein